MTKAQQLGLTISVAVCDSDGRLIALNRMDGAVALANTGSIGKAVVAAGSGRPSGEAGGFENPTLLRTSTAIGEGMPAIRRKGGLPIIRNGAIEGACGVGGAEDELTEECARAAITAIGPMATL
jgi:uncharacterized protein GlcG (DUF336 family)